MRQLKFFRSNKLFYKTALLTISAGVALYYRGGASKLSSSPFNAPEVPNTPGPISNFKTLAPLFADPFNPRSGELHYFLSKTCHLNDEEVKNLAVNSINNGQAEMLNTLTRYYPTVLVPKTLFELMSHATNPLLINALLSLNQSQLSPSLKALLNISSITDGSNCKILYTNELPDFLTKFQGHEIKFIAHNGAFHDDGRLVKGAVTHNSESGYQVRLVSREDDDEMQKIATKLSSSLPQTQVVNERTEATPSNFRPSP